MDEAAAWTLEELVQRVALALTGSAQAGIYSGAPNGRVRELPDQRMIRWYASIGVVDRPIGGRGRGARYGLRHLRQLVAVKQLQAQGLSLAEIQAQLAGVPDDELARLVSLPPEVLASRPPEGRAGSGSSASGRSEPRLDRSDSPSRRFWAVEPAPVAHGDPSAAPAPVPKVRPLAGLELAAGALLVLPVSPHPGDVAELAEAARPLLDALIRKGLIPRSAPLAEPTEGARR